MQYTQSVLIRNGPIRSTSEILAFFKKSPVELSKLRNGEKLLRNALVNPFNLRNGLEFLFPVVFHSRAVERLRDFIVINFRSLSLSLFRPKNINILAFLCSIWRFKSRVNKITFQRQKKVNKINLKLKNFRKVAEF